jgi:hypothetical protein
MFGLRLTGRVDKLEDDLRALRSEMQKATLDYLDIYAKAKKLFGRVAKAQAREEAETESAALDVGQAAPVGTSLSPRARLIQQQILARRAAQGGDRG